MHIMDIRNPPMACLRGKAQVSKCVVKSHGVKALKILFYLSKTSRRMRSGLSVS